MTKNTIRVDAAALARVLIALNGPPHLLRELTMTRKLPIGETNPIDILEAEYLEWYNKLQDTEARGAELEARLQAKKEEQVSDDPSPAETTEAVSVASKEYIGWRVRCHCYDDVWRTGDVVGVSQVGTYSAALHIRTKEGGRFRAHIKGSIKVGKTPTA